MPEKPVCTCLLRRIPGTSLAAIRVFDPFCQIKEHKEHGSTDLDPTYG
jgi:hypothetical protein